MSKRKNLEQRAKLKLRKAVAKLTPEQLTALEETVRKFIGDTTPCNVCGTPVNTDIHAEELGMCVECSNNYFTHKDEDN
jgi:hypothetical protein